MPDKALFSGEPLPVPPRGMNPETDAFYRKLIDYLRRLSGKIDRYAVGSGSVDAFVTTIAGDSDQALGAGAYEPIEWTLDIHKDSPFGHSISSDQEQITILTSGLYVFLCDLTINVGPTFPVRARLRILAPDGYVKYSLSEIPAVGTLALTVTVPLVAGTIVQIEAQDAGVTGGNVIEPDGTRLTILRLNNDTNGGTSSVPGVGWDGETPTWLESVVSK